MAKFNTLHTPLPCLDITNMDSVVSSHNKINYDETESIAITGNISFFVCVDSLGFPAMVRIRLGTSNYDSDIDGVLGNPLMLM